MTTSVLPEDLEGKIEVDDEVDTEEDVGGERSGHGADATAQEEGVEQVHNVVADQRGRQRIFACSDPACKQKCGAAWSVGFKLLLAMQANIKLLWKALT